MIDVLVVNHTKLICSVMVTILRDEPDIHVVGYATTVEETLKKAGKSEVILVDVNMPDDGAMTITLNLAKTHPKTHVLITGVEKHPKKILRYVEAGASGYVLKEVDFEDLLMHVRAVEEGKVLADPETVAHLVARLNELADLCGDQESIKNGVRTLTPREQEILDLLTDNLSNAEISEKLHIEVGTVKSHVHKVLNKLGVGSRYEAASKYKELTDETN